MLLHDIKSSVLSAPDSKAIVFGADSITYRELDVLSSKVASKLNLLGAKRDEIVAVVSERSIELLVGMIGVMKSGAAYTVVELTDSDEECVSRLNNCDADYALFNQAQSSLLNNVDLKSQSIQGAFKSELPDNYDAPVVSREDLAYVVYTSGTTGKPKGVAVSHRNVESYTDAAKSKTAIPAGLTYAHLSTLNADLGNTSLFLSLSTAGTLHIVGNDLKNDASRLQQYLIQNAIQFMKITPSHWNALFIGLGLQELSKMSLSYLVFGGEALPRSLALSLIENVPNVKLFNHYGPSECTVGTSMLALSDEVLADEGLKTMPIGYPLGEMVYRVMPTGKSNLSESGEGELYIAGPSVAKGYLNRDEETNKRFVQIAEDSDSPSKLFYKTGDRVLIDKDGLTHFIGRVDRQVKINGYRVELGHIENVMAGLNGVNSAACVIINKNGKDKLWGFVQTQDEKLTDQSLTEQLLSLIPKYMIPREFMLLESLPVTSNGKVDSAALKVLVEKEQAAKALNYEDESELDDLTRSIKTIFCRILSIDNAEIQDDFFELGGDSLDGIQMISELQGKGFAISTQSFLENPSVLGIKTCISEGADTHRSERIQTPYNADTLSTAQHFLLGQELSNYDHYNQAILFQTSDDIDANKLKAVIARLCENHPMLTTAYYRTVGGEIRHQPREWDDASFTHSEITEEDDGDEIIKEIASATQKSINLEKGDLFRCHLFKNEQGEDYILLVAHHLAVDLISWRILVSDLVSNYLTLMESGAPANSVKPFDSVNFFEWAAHLDQHTDKIIESSQTWVDKHSPIEYQSKPENTEANAKTIWLSFSPEETEKLSSELSVKTNSHLSVNLLAALASQWSKQSGDKVITVEMESHGRVTFDADMDISRVVGWHTSTYPIDIQCDDDLISTTANAQSSIDRVTDLGVAHGLAQKKQKCKSSEPTATILFNYLGDMNFSHEQQLSLSMSNKDIGFARGEDNNRLYDIKLTGKIVDQSLVLDISFSDPISDSDAKNLANGIRQALLAEIDVEEKFRPLYIEAGTRTGLLSFVPDVVMNHIDSSATESTTRNYKSVLLTGATGYLGVYTLKELIAKTSSHIYCLVRGKTGLPAEKRLRLHYREYFPHLKLDDFRGRITILEGDFTQSKFGLSDEVYRELTVKLDAIYHLGADTKLFGVESRFVANNIAPVRRLIELAKSCRLKDLHYMSTLAICGVNRSEKTVVFGENCLDVGQQFQNYYESTKYEAEKLIREYNLDTGRGFIYRTGNVSGHSKSAEFQANANENRFIQFLNACIKVGSIPKNLGEQMVLSPVDLVVSGMVAISLSRRVGGDIFHVDGDKPISMDDVFNALIQIGFEFERTDFRDFAELFTSVTEIDSEIALGRLWSLRESRNTRYDNSKTLALLKTLDIHFDQLDESWLVKFFETLVQRGTFSSLTALKEVG